MKIMKSKGAIAFLAALFVSLAFSPCLHAGDDHDEPQRRSRRLLAGSSSGLSAPKASDITFVTDENSADKGDLGEYMGKGTMRIPLKIDRYFGDKKKLLASGALPQHVQIEFVTYDVDEDADEDPEVDYMYFNESLVGRLRGSDGNYHRMRFEVDMNDVNLPSAPGAVGNNMISVRVDATDTDKWLTSIEWIAITIPAAPPVILSHGIRSDANTLNAIKAEIEDLGLPVHTFSYSNSGNDGIAAGGIQLAQEVNKKRNDWNVDTVNIVAHSMGGLKARAFVEKKVNPRTGKTDVMKVVQIATPNAGSPIADIGMAFRLGWENYARKHPVKGAIARAEYDMMFAATCGYANFDVFEDRSLLELTPNYMREYNSNHRLKSGVDFTIVAGDVLERMEPLGTVSKKMYEYVYSKEGPNDTVVSVASAHSLAMKNKFTNSGTITLVSHGGLVEDGAFRVMDKIRDEILTRKTPEYGSGSPSASVGSAPSKRMMLASPSTPVDDPDCLIFNIADLDSQTTVPFYVAGGKAVSVRFAIAGCQTFSWKVADPSGAEYSASAEGIDITADENSVLISIANAASGEWKFSFTPSGASGEYDCLYTFLEQEEDLAFTLGASLRSEYVKAGEAFVLEVAPRLSGAPLPGVVSAQVSCPDGSGFNLAALDDGVAPDAEAGDGIFTASIPAASAGQYWISANFSSTDPASLTRSAMLMGNASDSASAFADGHAAIAVDADGNGLYDNLVALLAANVTKSGEYSVLATLSDPTGAKITEGWTSNIVCSAGLQIFPVEFDGREIYANGECDGYVVSSAKLIEIGEDYEAVVDSRENLLTTTEYSYGQFEHSLAGMSPGGYDIASDDDGDGVFDLLTVTIPLYADDLIAGDYEWSASLFDAEGRTLAIDSGSVTFNAGDGGADVTLTFNGEDIAKTDLDGPYYVKSMIIWNDDGSHILPGEYATAEYSVEQWGGTSRHEAHYDFAAKTVKVAEGSTAVIRVGGGEEALACSMQVYLTYNTATAADLDLAKGTVDGVVPKGGLKFPLMLEWAAGETGDKTIEIPVKSDTALEGEEFFTLQLANPVGVTPGDLRVCTVRIQDRNTKATLSDGIANQTLKTSTSGAGKWYVVESWMAQPEELGRTIFLQSPDLPEGKTATLSFGTLKGSGRLYFDMKILGDIDDATPLVEIFDGRKRVGWLSRPKNYDNEVKWKSWYTSVSGSGSHSLSIVLTQGADPDSHARITNVYWLPSGSSSYRTFRVTASPADAGLASGGGKYANGTKISLNATPRPGYDFAGWFRASDGSLFGAKAAQSVIVTGDEHLIARFRRTPYVRGLADPAPSGKVTGSGFCAVGKSVALKAAANKGLVLEGWYDERGTRLTQAASISVDNSAKPAKPTAALYVVTNAVSDVTYFARFVTVEEDRASIECSVNGIALSDVSVATHDATMPCGVWASWPVVAYAFSQTTVKVDGLPSGLKYNAATGCIEGAPTAPSKMDSKTGLVAPSVVKLTVTSAGKSSKVYQINLTVTPMPDAALGVFNGFISPYDSEKGTFDRRLSIASFSLTTAANGKITVKTIAPKATASYAASYWNSLDDGVYRAALAAKSGEMLWVYLDSEPEYWNGENHVSGFSFGGSLGSEMYCIEAQRSSFLKTGKQFEHPEAVEVAKAMKGTYKFDATYDGEGFYELTASKAKTATLSVTINDTGAVAVAGTIPGTKIKFSGSGVLRVYPNTCEASLYVSAPYGKTANLMLVLDAAKDETTGAVSFTGGISVVPTP